MKPDKNSLLKNKLESRTILPSADAWSKLEAKLNNEETTIIPLKKKKNYLSVATSVIGIIAIGTAIYFLMNTNTQQANENNYTAVVKEQMIPQLNNNTVVETQPTVTAKTEEKQSAPISNHPEQVNKTNNTTQNYAVTTPEKVNDKKDSFTNNNNLPLIAQQEKQNYNADDEADKLLNKAMEDVQNKKYRNVLTQAKASVLLDDVETDIKNNKSLKSKIYTEVDKRYNQIKTVFVEK